MNAPIASATSGRLVFVTGAPVVRIGSDAALGGELYRARFKGAIPSARVRDGVVTIRYPRLAWFDWRKRIAGEWVNASAHWKRNTTEIVLNASLPWAVELRGGATALDADLRGVRLTSFDIAGGADALTLALGRPSGVVRVRVGGGVGQVTVSRPTDVAVTLAVAGGYRTAKLDGVEAWSPGQIASPGAESATDRFEIEISGDADRVEVRPGSGPLDARPGRRVDLCAAGVSVRPLGGPDRRVAELADRAMVDRSTQAPRRRSAGGRGRRDRATGRGRRRAAPERSGRSAWVGPDLCRAHKNRPESLVRPARFGGFRNRRLPTATQRSPPRFLPRGPRVPYGSAPSHGGLGDGSEWWCHRRGPCTSRPRSTIPAGSASWWTSRAAPPMPSSATR